ncbi:Subtilase family protein [Actinacidiphila cocklensis]|uniref:Subtilase family protein n=1 Tax=Actinacidiphila cocklensis TaxID=887465 RepID=A0A9W4E1C1_9ACTN|nr:Subtilase family protein [Actinacidiphila cocklensis]
MHKSWRKTRAAALAVGAAAALTAGAVAPAGATGERPAQSARASAPEKAEGAGAKSWVTLITGDRVGVSADGKPVALQHGKGREHIPVELRTAQGHAYALPLDAVRLIDQGRVDRRLFDVTTLNRPEYRKAQAHGLRYIVSYQGAGSAAKADLHRADGARVTRTYGTLDAEAVTAPAGRTADVWQALTNAPAKGTPYAAAEPGLKKVWLDAVQKASSLDWSRQQIGAPSAWNAGYDGTGVKIAVLDTGVDKDHRDLAGQVTDVQNFSTADNPDDHFGHGTHVASIAAGTGAQSGGTYKGVAPGAKIISGKVLDDDGFGDDSNILAGLEWAAESGAKIANLSLGGTDTPGTDVLESAVDTLSADYGTLFVIAAGNDGSAAGTVGSPGSADAALTVGAVDKDSALADFSSRGPRVGDDAVKPDVTAPGVDITAAAAPGSVIDQEVGENPPGYLTISGTSMATPHVAGAAADLAQEHPDWTGQQIKAALVAATTDSGAGYSPFEQGTGQVDLGKAVKQTVTAKSGSTSLSYATAVWPHGDDPKQTRTLTYTNTGSQAVALALAVKGTDPRQQTAPAGFFTLSADSVTVPAGGSASVDVTVDTTLGGSVDGAYTAFITATSADGQTVRTAAGVTREVESYDVTVKHLDRLGKATGAYDTALFPMSGDLAGQFIPVYGADGTATIRVPKGRYMLSSTVYVGDGTTWEGGDWINQPDLTVDHTTEVTVDARTARPVDLTVPDYAAVARFAAPDFSVETPDFTLDIGMWLDSYANFRTAHLGPAVAAGTLHESFAGTWTNGHKRYDLAYGAGRTTLATGYVRHAKAAELARIKVAVGTSVKGKKGVLLVFGTATGGAGSNAVGFTEGLPVTTTAYVNGGPSVRWAFEFDQLDSAGEQFEAEYRTADSTYTAGRSYAKTFNVGVFGPKIDGTTGLYRRGNEIYGYLPLFADGTGQIGASAYDTVVTTLYRNGKKVGSNEDPLTGEPFTVPAAAARYKLTTSVTRSGVAAVSTKVTATWTFSSRKTADEARLPASAVKFSPALSTASTSRAGASVKVPVSVQGSAAGRNLTSLKVWVSFDGGRHWKHLTVKNGQVTVANPKAGKGVSLRADVTDKKGNTLSQAIYNAYLTK